VNYRTQTTANQRRVSLDKVLKSCHFGTFRAKTVGSLAQSCITPLGEWHNCVDTVHYKFETFSLIVRRGLGISHSKAFEAALLEIMEVPRRNSEESHIFRIVPSESKVLSDAQGLYSKVTTHSLQAVWVPLTLIGGPCELCWKD